jgi:pimeloyl-ACP methyl ester carboxylesterase
MALALEEIEAQSFVRSAQIDTFSTGEEHDVQFTYSGGATAGNYVSSAHVTRTGRMKESKFTKTAIITLHDMGLNGFTNYATLFGCHEMQPILNAFTVFHVDFPCMKSPKLVNKNSSNYDDKENASPNGVESKSASVSGQWDPNLEYPSLDELAKAMLPAIMEFFSLSSVIIMGTGVGANVGIRYALAQPDKVMGLITLNPVFYQIGWHEWFNYKTQALSNDKLVELILSYLYTATELSNCDADLFQQTQQNINRLDHHALNGLYCEVKKRSLITMERPTGIGLSTKEQNDKVLDVSTCIIIGDYATNFMEDAMEFNSLCDPTKSNFVKLADAGAVVYEEQPVKVAEAIRLFLQGLGYLATIMPTRLARSRSNSVCSTQSIEEYNSTAAAHLAEAYSKDETPGQSGDYDASPSKQATIEVGDQVGLVN